MQTDKKRTSLVLMELIVCILFFSVVSALCTKIFVTAHLQNKKTVIESMALVECQSVMEIILSDNCSFETLKSLYPSASVTETSFTTSDENGNTVRVNLSYKDKMCTVTVDYKDIDDNPVMCLETSKFTGGGAHEE